MKSILITGAGGFIGSHAVNFFKASGYDTYGLGHSGLLPVESNLDNWRRSIDFFNEGVSLMLCFCFKFCDKTIPIIYLNILPR